MAFGDHVSAIWITPIYLHYVFSMGEQSKLYRVDIGGIYHGIFYLSMCEFRENMAPWHQPKRESLSYTTNMMASNSFYTLCHPGLRFDYSDSEFIC